MNTKHAAGVFMALSILTVFASCEILLNPPKDRTVPHNGQGHLVLSFNGLGVEQTGGARTILPVTVFNDFVKFDLNFTSAAWGGEPQSVTVQAVELASPVQVPLPAGIGWDLAVTGYVSDGEGGYLPAAEGGETGIVITGGGTTSKTITLTAIIDTGRGTFSYTLEYPADVTTASLTVTPFSNTGTPVVIDITGSAKTGVRSLGAGYYRVVAALSNAAGSTGKREILHIYRNLTSNVEYIFTKRDFLLPTVTFNENGGNELDPELAVQTVEAGTAFSAITPPTATRTDYTFAGWYTEANGGVQYTAGSNITADITLYARWNVATVTAPAVPTVTSGNSLLTVSWAAVSGASAYEVWMGTSNNSASSVQYGGDVDGLSVAITGLSNETTYYIWIKAKNSAYTSGFSPVASGIPFVEWLVTTFAGSTQGYTDETGTTAQFYYPNGVAVDSAGDVYVADRGNNRVRKITPGGTVTTFAGSGVSGSADGTGTVAQFSSPSGMAVDSAGNVYVAETGFDRIRKITPGGVVTTLAGSTEGYADGTGTAAQFSDPSGVAVDSAGNVYVADRMNWCIRKITPGGVVTTLAGGTFGFANGTGTAAQFFDPSGVAVDSAGNVYVGDGAIIRKITPSGVVTTIAGSSFTSGSADGTGAAARFNGASDVAVDGSGNVYVTDTNNHRIRKITPGGVVTTIAGSTEGYADGIGTAAQFYYPNGVAVDSTGNVYVADRGNNRIRKMTRDEISSNYAVSYHANGASGPIPATQTVNAGTTITIAGQGGLTYSDRIFTGWNTEPAGTGTPYSAEASLTVNSNIILYAQWTIVYTVTYHANGAAGPVPAAQTVNAGTTITVAGQGSLTYSDRIFAGWNTDPSETGTPYSAGAPLTVNSNITLYAQWNMPVSAPGAPTVTPGNSQLTVSWAAVTGASAYEVWVGTSNNSASSTKYGGDVSGLSVTVTGLSNETIYYIWIKAKNSAYTSGFSPVASGIPFVAWLVSTFAGGSGSGSADGTGTVARFSNPSGVAVDSTGNVYVADRSNNRIRKITPGGVVTTLAGSGTSGYADGTGTTAQFTMPYGVAVDGVGNVYVADTYNHRIRKITPDGVVTTFAGSGTSGYADGTGTVTQFNSPIDVAMDGADNVYVADMGNNRIRKITPGGVVTTLAGSTAGSADGTGTAAQFDHPSGVTVDSAGNVYAADSDNYRIRKITSEGVVTTLAGSTRGYADGTGTAAQFKGPNGVTVDSAGNVYVADTYDHRIRKITPGGVVTTLAGSGPSGGIINEGGYADGIGTTAQFDHPTGVVVDNAGNTIYVGDFMNNRIRKMMRQ